MSVVKCKKVAEKTNCQEFGIHHQKKIMLCLDHVKCFLFKVKKKKVCMDGSQ